VRRALGHLAAVSLAAIVTAGVLGGAGELIIVGHATPSPATLPLAARTELVSPAPTAEPIAMTEAAPAMAPVATAPPLTLTAFRFAGHGYLGISTAESPRTFTAPFAGTVEIRTYQFIGGDVRVGSNVTGLPFFPYVAVSSSDRRIVYRPGPLGSVTEMLVTDGATVQAGDPLFRLVAPGVSSWATFYDRKAPYQVVVSLTNGPGDLDPAVYFSTP
jgi:biotin carboxyl carrier protein